MKNKRRAKRIRWLSIYKETKGCSECREAGITYRWPRESLQFDHRDPNDKQFNVTTDKNGNPIGIKGRNAIKVLMEEVRKCDVVCGNHHAISTRSKKQYDSYK